MKPPHPGRKYRILRWNEGKGSVLQFQGEVTVIPNTAYEWAVSDLGEALRNLARRPTDGDALFCFCRKARKTKLLYLHVLLRYKGQYPTGKLMAIVSRAKRKLPVTADRKIARLVASIRRHLDQISAQSIEAIVGKAAA